VDMGAETTARPTDAEVMRLMEMQREMQEKQLHLQMQQHREQLEMQREMQERQMSLDKELHESIPTNRINRCVVTDQPQVVSQASKKANLFR